MTAGYTVRDALNRGLRFGIIASGDGHVGHPGKQLKPYFWGAAGIWAKNLSRASIWEALYERYCYGTSGSRIVLFFTINGVPMGRAVSSGGRALLEATVYGTSELKVISIIKNGYEVTTIHQSGFHCICRWFDPMTLQRGDYYYIRVLQKDDSLAWSSPIWVE